MKATQFAILISLFLLINSLDESTFSNYQDIYMNSLTGEFKIDFDKKIVIGNLEYNFTANTQGEKIVLDTKSLDIKEVEKIEIDEDGKKVYTKAEFSLEEKDDPIFGKALTIKISYEKGDSRLIRIKYETTKEGISAQFLEKEQTLGKKYPIFFTYSPLISGRSLFPCQDTPAVKFTFDLKIIVPEGLKGMIAGIYIGEEDYIEEEGETVNYSRKFRRKNYY